ncbi:MAG: sigma-70 family RNA polymerase sigma factor [Oscillospiraceae bacterium]|nr:sigma-70 family RNA polymerase sigma factor [Oscillospiraceae bacterium]
MSDRINEEELVSRHTRLVRACARPYFLVGGDAEDLIQEGMLGLLSAIRGFDETRGVKFETFAEICVRRRIISAVRASASRHNERNDVLLDESPGAYLRDPEELVIARERVRELTDSINDSLSKYESTVLGLYLDGFTYGEMAKSLDKPYKSVENAISRIRKKLARFYSSGDNR